MVNTDDFDLACDMDDFWVFGYGSLMWNPGFPFEERQKARLHGYRRALCISSNHYRGTDEIPGLVLGLERGGSCHGVAFRVDAAHHGQVMDYLHARELVSHVYKERVLTVSLLDGRRPGAVTYVADPEHKQFASGLSVAEAAAIVCKAVGSAGSNVEYVLNTVEHLKMLGIRDALLEKVADCVQLTLQRQMSDHSSECNHGGRGPL